jgi:tetratricopeptide (TPR) repeat protein
MFGCRKYQSWIAAALYEPLDEAEQSQLDCHLAACPRCRAEASALGALRLAIPSEPVVFTGDLLPALRARIAEGAPSAFPWRRFAAVMASLLVVAAVTGVWLGRQGSASVEPRMAATASDSALSPMLAKADALIAQHDYASALQTLNAALKRYPNDSKAGDAALRVADLQFASLQRYADAYAAYQTVRSRYPEAWRTSPGAVKDRFDLLAENHGENFAALHALDAARDNSADPVGQLEKVVAHYPGRLVAWQAVNSMREKVCGARDGGGDIKAAALESVRARCSDPVAVAHINVELGDTYWHEMHDPGRARVVYYEALQSGHGDLAGLARVALNEIDQGQ